MIRDNDDDGEYAGCRYIMCTASSINPIINHKNLITGTPYNMSEEMYVLSDNTHTLCKLTRQSYMNRIMRIR